MCTWWPSSFSKVVSFSKRRSVSNILGAWTWTVRVIQHVQHIGLTKMLLSCLEFSHTHVSITQVIWISRGVTVLGSSPGDGWIHQKETRRQQLRWSNKATVSRNGSCVWQPCSWTWQDEGVTMMRKNCENSSSVQPHPSVTDLHSNYSSRGFYYGIECFLWLWRRNVTCLVVAGAPARPNRKRWNHRVYLL